jgi:tetratricopeptide (TPR) repeat protein
MGRSKRRLVLLLVLAVVAGLGVWQGGRVAWGKWELRAARTALLRRDFAGARAHLDRCLGIWPHDAETLVLAAQAARRGGDLGEANRLLREHQQFHGISDALALERRLLRFQGGDLKEADGYLAYCKESPDSPQTPLVLEAVIQGGLRSGDLERAMRAADLWLAGARTTADQVQGLVWRGDIWIQTGSAEKALPDYIRAVELDGEDDIAQLHLAACQAASAPRQAMANLEKLLRRHPGDPSARHQLARCHRNLGQLEEAARLLDELLAQYPDDAAVLSERGAVALDLGESAAAEAWLRRACALSPENPKILRIQARCLRQNGKGEEGERAEARAAEIDKQRGIQARKLFMAEHPPAP